MVLFGPQHFILEVRRHPFTCVMQHLVGLLAKEESSLKLQGGGKKASAVEWLVPENWTALYHVVAQVRVLC